MSAAPVSVALCESPLTVEEEGDLKRLEITIERGLDRFREMGLALMQIRDRRLYREDFETFKAYCKQKWHFTRRHGDNLIQAAKVVLECETNGRTAPTSIKAAVAIDRKRAADVFASGDEGAIAALPHRSIAKRRLQPEVRREAAGVAKTKAIERSLDRLRELISTHPWRSRGLELLKLFEETVLPFPPDAAQTKVSPSGVHANA
jgi:hypothetical protein